MSSSSHPTPRPPPIGVAIADPHALFRDALTRAVRAHPALAVNGSADSVELLHAAQPDDVPDVLVIDTELAPRARDFTLTHLTRGWEPAPAVLLVAEAIDGPQVFAALEAGVRGYLSKEQAGEILCRAIVDVARGDTVLDPDAQALMAGELRLRRRDDRPMLSPREQEILNSIADGRTAPQIAARLHLSTSTVKTHMLHIYDKLGVTERAAAVAAAMRWGLIE